mgnify:CR=1 FL=1
MEPVEWMFHVEQRSFAVQDMCRITDQKGVAKGILVDAGYFVVLCYRGMCGGA